MKEFRTLKAEEIECRVGQVFEKSNAFTLLLYKNARVDMDILDETVGRENWQRDHKEVKGNLYGGVAIWDATKNQWITKWDCGAESNTEKEKGEASDSFKRACVNWGIGRELYTAPFIFIKCEQLAVDYKGKPQPPYKSMYVSAIEYDDNRKISFLEIIGDKEIIFTTNKTEKRLKQEFKTTNDVKSTTTKSTDTGLNIVLPNGKYKGMEILNVASADRQYVEWMAENCGDRLKKSAQWALENTKEEECPF